MQPRVDWFQEGGVPCGCGRSPTGFCTGLHALSEEEYDRHVMEGLVYPGEKPKGDGNDAEQSNSG